MSFAFPRREIRDVVVDHGDGTVSALMEAKFLDLVDGVVRVRRSGDVARKPAWRAPVVREAA